MWIPDSGLNCSTAFCASGGFRLGHQAEHLLKRTLIESPRVMRAWPVYDGVQSPHPWGVRLARQGSRTPPCSRGSYHSVASGPYAGKSGEVCVNPAYATTCTHRRQQLSAAICLDAGSLNTAKHRASKIPGRIFGRMTACLPDILQWVLRTIRHDYTMEFRKGPPLFSGILPTTVFPGQATLLRQEIVSLLEKGAIEELPPTRKKSGFYSRYCSVPKKDGGLHPILDLHRLNRALRVSKFKMLTVKSILSQIQPRDWFVTIDLKDAYFHIQIVKRRRKFPKVCFRGQSLPILCSPVWKATGHPNTYIVILRNAAYGRSSGPVAALGCPHFELLGQLANISSIARSST